MIADKYRNRNRPSKMDDPNFLVMSVKMDYNCFKETYTKFATLRNIVYLLM